MKRIENRHYTIQADKDFQVERVELFLDVPSERSGPYLYDHITPFQFAIQTQEANVIDVFIPWAELSPPYLRGRSLFMRYDDALNRWRYVASTREKEGWRLKLTQGGVYALAYNMHQELELVDDVVSGFPDWYAGRKDRNSNLRRLTNALLDPYVPIESGIEELAAMANLFALDSSQLLKVQKFVASEISSVDRAKVYLNRSGFYQELNQAESVEDFLFDPTKEKVLVDFRRGAVLSLEQHDGQIEVELTLAQGTTFVVPEKREEALWNDFDEIGLLYGVRRIKDETNATYRKRLATLFSHPGNATRTGVRYETARQLGMIVTADWVDDTKGFLVINEEARTIIGESIQVDGKPVIVEWQADGGFLIPPTGEKRPHEVVFFYGVESYRPDRTLADDEGLLSPYHEQILGEIGNKAPLLYGQAKWGLQEWDMTVDDGLIEWFGQMDHDSEKWRD